jgi:hypothetical protein
MPKYGASFGAFATTTSILTALKLVTATKVPVEIVEAAMFGSGTVAPADIQHECTLAAVSAAGAGTGTASPPTPEPFGPNKQQAASSSFLWKMTAEPTTYATVFPVLFSFNQRGGMRWAVPRGEGMGNVFEATQMHIGQRVRSSAVGTVDGHLHFWE